MTDISLFGTYITHNREILRNVLRTLVTLVLTCLNENKYF